MTFIVRCILTSLLLIGVYVETGIFTTLALALLAVNIEIIGLTFVKMVKKDKE